VRISLSAYPDSEIDGTALVLREGQSIELPFVPGAFVSRVLDWHSHGAFVNFEIGIQTKEYVGVLAENIPSDSQLHIIGVSRNNFIGLLEHPHLYPGAAPRCELRCTPNDKPVVGPGCISCKKSTLRFKVCC
jgi:hypothetical protein